MQNKPVNILLVEDDEVDIKNIRRALARNNMHNDVFTASNGENALHLLREKVIPSPLVILLDLNMPKMDGIEFLAELRKDPMLKPISVVVMSTSSQEDDKLAAYKYNVSGYIVKSMDNEQFMESVDALRRFWSVCSYPEYTS
jgi:CheY-like chemotaxis protein